MNINQASHYVNSTHFAGTKTGEGNLVFVYNSDQGFAAALFDSAHKLLSPQTYACNLCALTHSLAGPKKLWREFIESLAASPAFLHRNEFQKEHPARADVRLPAIFWQSADTEMRLIADGDELSRIETLEALIARVSEAQK